jgi:UDP-N-acetylglucosamine 4-epimerase
MFFELLKKEVEAKPKTWLITGVAGFIGSNLLETLLRLNQNVVGLDNLSAGYRHNLKQVQELVTSAQWKRFKFIEGDICDDLVCNAACKGVDLVLHQAAIGSVSRSIKEPEIYNRSNVDGFLNMLVAARNAKVTRFVYASSSSCYGDHPDMPKVEERIGKPLSPYAATKIIDEIYADLFYRTYGLKCIGLRYFNVFGPRQNPNGDYAAVIPKWISAIIRGEPVYINGDGETSRDFCYIKNAIQANLLAALINTDSAINQIYNVAVGKSTSLNQLYELINTALVVNLPHLELSKPIYCDFRRGDIRHSLANISKGQSLLGYNPTHQVEQGLNEVVDWYIQSLS